MSATWRAPGRVNLIGDHTDHSGGWVLPLAIGPGTTVTVTSRSTGRVRADSALAPDERVDVRLDRLDDVPFRWARYVTGAVQVVREEGVVVDGADVRVESDLPVAAGLSSSAALVCGTLAALLDALGERWDRQRIALAAQRVENVHLGAPVGVMDPMVVMQARADHALLLDTRALSHEQIPLHLVRPGADEGLCLLVVDTHESHSTSGLGYAERVEQCRTAARQLGVASLREVSSVGDVTPLTDPLLRARARHVVTENGRVLTAAALLRDGRVDEVGPVLTASHESLRDDFGVSTEALDLVVGAALSAGALGARLTGAGMGGCALALTPAGRAREISSSIQQTLAEQGIDVTVRSVWAAQGARRLARGT